MFWHSDKSVYQRDTSLKIAAILVNLSPEERQWSPRQKQWFESCLYIFNKHWDKVDNFRIDKYLMLVRNIFNAAFQIFKRTDYDQQDMEWFCQLIGKWFSDNLTAQGLLLQMVDIFVPEMGKVNNQISLTHLSKLLEPFLNALANTQETLMLERLRDQIFHPLLQSNVTIDSDSEDSEPEDLKAVDGGKLSKRTRKEVKALINQKFVFENMNILMYAENYIFKVASSPSGEGILEGNREQLYQLYNYALQLEPDAKPELTFSERMIVNKARGFITKRMKRRAEIRNLKNSKKADRKMKKMMSDQIFEQFKDQLRA